MGAKGLIKIVCQKRTMYSYNHIDSYPKGLGVKLVKEIRSIIKNHDLDWLIERVSKIKYVSNDTPPTEKEISKLYKFADGRVSKQSLNDWYCLLRKTQGSIKKIINAGYILNEGFSVKNESNDKLIEYVYVIDLDNKKFYLKNNKKYPIGKIPEQLFNREWCENEWK
jgi:hypothetical protein